jgi:hypothetical protein
MHQRIQPFYLCEDFVTVRKMGHNETMSEGRKKTEKPEWEKAKFSST